MQFFSALVEHLVVGVIALLWAIPFLNYCSLLPDGFANNKEVILGIGVPVAYLVGMYIDVLASCFTSLIRRLIDVKFKKCRTAFFGGHLLTKDGTSYERTVKILSKSPDELARYFLQLSGREKIARGAFMNLFIAMLCNIFLPTSKYSINSWLLMALSLIGIMVWLRLNALTDTFKLQAVKSS